MFYNKIQRGIAMNIFIGDKCLRENFIVGVKLVPETLKYNVKVWFHLIIEHLMSRATDNIVLVWHRNDAKEICISIVDPFLFLQGEMSSAREISGLEMSSARDIFVLQRDFLTEKNYIVISAQEPVFKWKKKIKEYIVERGNLC